MALASEAARVKSDVVILQHHEGGWTPSGGTKAGARRERPRYSLLCDGAESVVAVRRCARGLRVMYPRPPHNLRCDGAEWVVAEGEQNVWSTLVLFVLHRAKRGGFLSSIDLRDGMVPSFLHAMSSADAATVPFPTATTAPLAVRAILSVLQPSSPSPSPSP